MVAALLHRLGRRLAIYRFDPTPAQHRSSCALIKRAARDDKPPTAPPAPPAVTGDPTPAAAVAHLHRAGRSGSRPGSGADQEPIEEGYPDADAHADPTPATPHSDPDPHAHPDSTPTPTETLTPTPTPTPMSTPSRPAADEFTTADAGT